ncbi:MAG: radical SAM family heme chaperone HemW [Anaeroplasmataceae bacterium]|nr:radical SAM family heme chaperone HemW [Anaeroplasmataceae bacterium]
MRGLYIHIPFCKSICSYCDFPKMIAKEEEKIKYLDALIKELELYKDELVSIDTVYIGGGTPNSLSDELLEQLLKALKPYLECSIENTIEMNCELFTLKQAQLFKKYHINRVSIGVQTFQSHLIKKINRFHQKEDVFKAIQILESVGIQNINIDMMLGLPGQTLLDLDHDLAVLKELKITHLSYYSLILEDKTVLNYQIKLGQVKLPDDDLVADMINKVNQNLKMRHFNHYEVSNYALKGFESKHNLIYWNTEEYIGIGAGACGYIHSKRYKNHIILSKYYEKNIEEEEFISVEEQKSEFMMLGLRKLSGISILEYQQKFNSSPFEDFKLEELISKGLLRYHQDRLWIDEEHILLGNLVFETFVG